MPYELFVQAIISGILLGGVYGLIAVGLTLVFGVMKIINFAHGEFLMLAMYGAFFFWMLTGVETYAAALILVPALFLVGMGTYRFLVKPIIAAPPLNQMLLLIGLSLVLQNGALALFSPDTRSVQSDFLFSSIFIDRYIIGVPQLIAFLVSITVCVALVWFIRGTEFGRQIRAASSDREAAALMGIDVQRVNLIAFGIGIATLGVAGAVMMPTFYVVPNVGSFFILIAFVVVVLGGLGNFAGALIASFVVAIAESVGALVMPGSTAPVLPFILFIVALLFRPEGLFAVRTR